MQIVFAVDLDDICACASDISAHRVEEIRNINDVRLLGCILDNCLSLSPYSRKHSVHRSAYSNEIEIDLVAYQLVSLDMVCAPLYLVGSAQSFESFQVLVDRSVTERTSARH